MFNSRWFPPVILFLACLAAYSNSFLNNFLFDDNSILFGQSGVLNKSFGEIFSQNQGIFYRPIGHIPLWFFSRFLGDNFVGYHIVNFILFLFIGFLFYLLVQKLTLDSSLAFLSTLLYLVHPINGFIVNYVTASVIAVFVLMILGSFLCFIQFFEEGDKKYYAAGFILFIYACFSHEMAMVFPLYLVAYLFFIKKYPWGRIIKLLCPFILSIPVWFVFRFHESNFHLYLVNFLSLWKINGAAYFSTWINLIAWYVTKLFLPQNILYMWNSEYGLEHFFRNVLFLFISLVLGVYVFYRWKKDWKSFFLTVFVIGFLPTLFICFIYFPTMKPFIEPHWFYFSSMGIFVLLGKCLQVIISKNKRMGSLLAVGVVCAFVILSWEHNSKWKTQGTYSKYWLSLNRENLIPYCGLGRSLMDRGDYAGAIRAYQEGTKHLNLMTVPIAADMGHCWDMLGNDREALYFLIMAIRENRSYALGYQYLGHYYDRRGNSYPAEKAFKVAVALDPNILSLQLRKLY